MPKERMPKQLGKKLRRFNRPKRRFRLVMSVIVVSVISMMGLLFWQYHQKNLEKSAFLATFQQTKQWLNQHKEHLKQGYVKVKQFAKANPEPPPIHFEFYSALPNMQIKVAPPTVQKKPVVAATMKTPKKSPKIFDEEKLAQEVSSQLHQTKLAEQTKTKSFRKQ